MVRVSGWRHECGGGLAPVGARFAHGRNGPLRRLAGRRERPGRGDAPLAALEPRRRSSAPVGCSRLGVQCGAYYADHDLIRPRPNRRPAIRLSSPQLSLSELPFKFASDSGPPGESDSRTRSLPQALLGYFFLGQQQSRPGLFSLPPATVRDAQRQMSRSLATPMPASQLQLEAEGPGRQRRYHLSHRISPLPSSCVGVLRRAAGVPALFTAAGPDWRLPQWPTGASATGSGTA